MTTPALTTAIRQQLAGGQHLSSAELGLLLDESSAAIAKRIWHLRRQGEVGFSDAPTPHNVDDSLRPRWRLVGEMEPPLRPAESPEMPLQPEYLGPVAYGDALGDLLRRNAEDTHQRVRDYLKLFPNPVLNGLMASAASAQDALDLYQETHP